MAAPAAVEERGLVDHVGAGPHRGEGLGLGGGELGDGVAGHGDLDDGLALGDQPFDVLGLVLLTAGGEHVEHGVVALGAVAFAAGGRQLELGEVLARGEAGEVARAERERSIVEKVHGCPTPPGTRARRRVLHSFRALRSGAAQVTELEAQAARATHPQRLAFLDDASAERDVLGERVAVGRVRARRGSGRCRPSRSSGIAGPGAAGCASPSLRPPGRRRCARA